MGVAITCPRCGGAVRPPDLMHSVWRCDVDGAVVPLHVPRRIDSQILETARTRVRSGAESPPPMWCPWPLPTGWTLTGVGWVADDRSGVRATIIACSGPGPVEHGPADVLLVAEEPGIGLGARLAGIPGPDPGAPLAEAVSGTAAHARVRAGGWPTPLWVLDSPPDRSAYVGEACGLWLYVVCWPAAAGFVLAEDLVLHDLRESVPLQLEYGAPCPHLHGEG